MIIDKKGRIFGKINIVDFAAALLLLLILSVTLKFIFFRPDFFHYQDAYVTINFSKVQLADLIKFQKQKYPLFQDNNSYLFIKDTDFSRCISEKKIEELQYYFNGSYSLFPELLLVNCTSDVNNLSKFNDVEHLAKEYVHFPKKRAVSCQHSNQDASIFYFNESFIAFPEGADVDCRYAAVLQFSYRKGQGKELTSLICKFQEKETRNGYYFLGLPGDAENYSCDSQLTLKLKARSLDTGLFYRNYEYGLSKGNPIHINVNGVSLFGRVERADETFND